MQVSIKAGYEVSEIKPDARVIIDVFRASTTCIAILEGNPESLFITNDFGFLKQFSADGHLVVSEVFDLGLDNSPTLIKSHDIKGRKVALKTTNLTTALEKNAECPTYIGCFNNLESIFTTLRSKLYRSVEIVPAGYMALGKMNVEDGHCAEILRQSLEEKRVISPNPRLLEERIQDISKNPKPRPDHYIPDLSEFRFYVEAPLRTQC